MNMHYNEMKRVMTFTQAEHERIDALSKRAFKAFRDADERGFVLKVDGAKAGGPLEGPFQLAWPRGSIRSIAAEATGPRTERNLTLEQVERFLGEFGGKR